jgi:hypothetical protein
MALTCIDGRTAFFERKTLRWTARHEVFPVDGFRGKSGTAVSLFSPPRVAKIHV